MCTNKYHWREHLYSGNTWALCPWVWGEVSTCAFTLDVISRGISCGQDAGLCGPLAWSTTISVGSIFLVKTKRSSHSWFCVVFIHEAREQSQFWKSQRRWWLCHSNEGVTLVLRGVFHTLFLFLKYCFILVLGTNIECDQRGFYFRAFIKYRNKSCFILSFSTDIEKCLLLILRNNR